MLSEYSGSAAATATAAPTAAEKAANAASATVAVPPPPSIPPLADVVAPASGMDSLAKAASAAQDAADQAAAAGGIQFKPLIKPVVGGMTGVKMPYQVDPAKVNENTYDYSAKARENMATLKSNFFNGIDSITGGVDSAKGGVGSVKETATGVSTGDFSIDIESLLKIDSVSISPAVVDFVASLHLKEYGGWYVAAAMAAYASQQRAAGREDAGAAFESELAGARQKASEAASAAGLAAQGAATAKKLAIKMEKDLKKDGGKAILDSSRSKMVLMERDMMEKELHALQAEVSALRKQLAASEGVEKKIVQTKTVKTEIEEEYPTKVVMERDSDEDGRIVELLKLLDEENQIKKQKAAAELEKRREEEAKFVAAEKQREVSRKMTKGVEAAQAKAELAKKKKAATKKAKKAATKAKRKPAPKKAATKKTPTLTKKAARTSTAVDDWASLAESTLKRKTVAQLTEYLTRKGVSATDSSGKSLKKAELLEAVKSL